ncbi:MAG: penicillin acylase family protein [Thermoplasmata archaeon]
MKLRWLIIFVVLILVASYFSDSFTVLNPGNGAWTTAGNANYTSETINVPGLTSPVKVTMDASGVAHIYAKDNYDLFYAQGYYVASNRLFQMELQVLAASGNLSKYVGSSALGSDMAMRLIGLPENAYMLQQSYMQNYPQYYSYLKAYSDGVNAFINKSSESLGFKLLGVTPFYWSPFYTLVWEEYMTWSLTTGAAEPLQNALFYNAFGFENTTTIWPYYPYYTQNVTNVPGDGTVNGYNLSQQNISPNYLWSLNWFDQWATGINTTLLATQSALINDAIANISDPYMLPETQMIDSAIGSNSWVVTANYSESGYPMLANDPHLNLLAPSVWIPMQLNDPDFNVTGWALAGIPGILIGHTQYTAWGLTTPEGNTANEYLEFLNNDQYLYNGTWHNMAVQNYTLLGKSYSIYYTNNGPLLARNAHYGISLNWVITRPAYVLVGELLLDQSQNYTDMINALRYWGYPAQNFAMVSVHNAGILTAGWYPLINETLPDGAHVQVVGARSLLNGSMPQYQYAGYVPFQYLPQAENPSRGFMFAPNQPTVGENYPYPFIGGFWASGGRAQTIYHYLSANAPMTVQKMMQLQSNVSDYWASMLTPYIIESIKNMNMNITERVAFNYLLDWNYTTYQDEVGITVYWYFLSELYNLSFNKTYNENGLAGLPAPFVTTLIYLVQNDPNSSWLNYNFTMLARSSFNAAVLFLEQHLGSNVSAWTWGKVHMLEIYSLTQLTALSIGPIPIWGDDHTVSVGSVPLYLQVPEPYVTVGSSLRTVASPGTDQFYGVFPGGPSENVLSYYFSNQLNTWLNHEYYNMNEQRTRVVWNYE